MLLKTERTYIRPFVREDLDELQQLCTSVEVMQYIPPYFSTETPVQVSERLNRWINHYEEHGLSIGYVSNLNGEFIGAAGLLFSADTNKYELGYMLLPAFQGLGYAQEVVAGLVEYAFRHLYMDSIAACTLPGNTKSESVLTKNGFAMLGERAFNCKGQLIIWSYFEKENDDLAVQEHAGNEEWDFII